MKLSWKRISLFSALLLTLAGAPEVAAQGVQKPASLVECVDQGVRALQEPVANPILEPGKVWRQLYERKTHYFANHPGAPFPDFDAPEMKPTLDFIIGSLVRLRDEVLAHGGATQTHLFDELIAKAQALKLKNAPIGETFAFASEYSVLAARTLQAISTDSKDLREGLAQAPLAPGDDQGAFLGLFGTTEFSQYRRLFIPVLVHQSFNRMDAVLASPYPLSWIGVTDKFEEADTLRMSPLFWLGHDWGHYLVSKMGQERVLGQISEAEYLKLIPTWEENVKKMHGAWSSLPSGPLKDAIEIVAFELTHEQGFPPTARFWPKMGQSLSDFNPNARRSLREEIQLKIGASFYGHDLDYHAIHSETLDHAWAWLAEKLP